MADRILYVHNSADIYGASRCLVRLIERLPRDRFEPWVVVPEEGPLRPALEAAGAHVILHRKLSVITRRAFKSWRIAVFAALVPWSVLFLVWTILRLRAVLVHTNTGVIVSVALAARLARVPHVWHIRDWFGEFRPIWKYYERYIRAGSDSVLCVSNPIAEQFSPDPKVRVVHDGFSEDEFSLDREAARVAFRKAYGIGEDEFVVGNVGRIKWVRKGQEILVKAIAILRDRGVRVRGILVGSPFPGNERHLDDLRRLIDHLRVGNQLVLTGELADPRPAYAAMDVFALTSAQPEPFGGVVMESMGIGIPVVATAIGGSLDQVADGETGILVPPADPEALANAIEHLAADAEARRAMGAAGRKRLAARFSLDGMVAEILDAYSGLRSNGKGVGRAR